MLQLTDKALYLYFKYRQKRIEQVISHVSRYQEKLLSKILQDNRDCTYGRLNGFKKTNSYQSFKERVPLVRYEDISSYVSQMMNGEKNILCSDDVTWFAKSSGTSNNRSKYIPVSKNYLVNGHLKCTWAMASFIYNEDSGAKLFANKNLIMGGSLETLPSGLMAGDISAILLHHFPPIGRRFYSPDFETALMPDWEEKIKKIAEITIKEKITLLGGVPTWTLVLLKEVLRQSGAGNISEVWPTLRSYLHGGIGFEPYRSEFKKIIPWESVVYRNIYNASEGYFAIQNNKDEEGMLLLCDHQIFYEFVPLEEIESTNPRAVRIHETQLNQKYAIVITNSSGLYRYIIGDVVMFTSLAPYKIRVMGRIQQNINVFGEEVMIHNTDQAIAETSSKLQAIVNDYTVAPIYMEAGKSGAHEWAIEFKSPPLNIMEFAVELDKKLQQLNSDYAAKRTDDMVLRPLIIHALKPGTFDKWLRKHNKYGGQNKVPRLKNDRKFLDDILALS